MKKFFKYIAMSKNKIFYCWKYIFKPFIYTFVIVIILQIITTTVSTNNKMWKKKSIPYNVKIEWILDNYIRNIRFNSFIAKSDSYTSKLLQKIHFLVYESAKSKIPENDPFWIKFWEPASDFPIASQKKIEYSDEIRKEILKNLQLISANKSKVESFNNYHRYLFVSEIYYRITEKIVYKTTDIRSNFELDVLNISKPIIEDFFNNKFDFYQYKNDISRSSVQGIPYNFLLELIYTYMDLIITEKQETCNVALKELILDNSADYVHKDQNLDALQSKIQKLYKRYNKQYDEYCRINN